MARGRMLSITVATDLALNELSLAAHCAYLMAIPHLDRDGIMAGHPKVVAAVVCPLRLEFCKKMPAIIDEWIAAGLVVAYGTGNGKALYFTGFQKNQSLGASYAREGKSVFPPPPGYARGDLGLVLVVDDQLATNSEPTHDQLATNSARAGGHARVEEKINRREVEEKINRREVEVEGKGLAPAATATDPDVARVWEAWNANMPGTKSQVITDRVNDLLAQYSATEIIEAIAIACKRNKRTLGYVQGVLSKGVYSQAPPANDIVRKSPTDKSMDAANEFRAMLKAQGKEHLLDG